MPLVLREDLLLERIPTLSSACFSYELDVLGEMISVYSATNPTATRFDVIRVALVRPSVIISGDAATEEHSWFPPYKWRMSACICGQHLGWAFSNDSGDQFLGIIVTKLSPREVSASELDDIIQLQNEAIHRFSILRLHHENDDQEEDDEEEEDDDEEEVDEVEEEDEVVEEDNEEEERNENGEDDERVRLILKRKI